ncbi:MAG: F0F1 ATP synthase subunit A [Alphaproteobacteria bacterium]
MDPMHQFQIHPLIPIRIPVAGHLIDISFTNSSLLMIAAVLVTILFLMLSMGSRSLVPGRAQSVAELSYEFIANMIRDTAGPEGMRYFPFIYALFVFILACNFLGLLPFSFTVMSHIIVTFAMALAVIISVVIIGFARHGLGFLKLFAPSGIPLVLMPLVILIEIMSFLIRPFSLGLRLFANMLAGHLILDVFASFVIGLAGLGTLGIIGAIAPFAMSVAMSALELLVAFLQAYVFAILSSIYLRDALHPGH